ncbi:Sodium/potassium/calcium exchanger 2 (Na(+)/K(+)/Ca(2+)-exchange protein 2) (Retinal cone Na-Ca+K exchanger) (Solute carrier family 24 member 2) [Durusdinium trenchii]|uniref:Sodium/potassium/calcium exchanger 2 (Na(+)/K(+)/Ca(2+)-exchange protein 2) (Retinal cone Na-Ca+K exchanger) (Solute carrier family 24 member 2) n=1 Tax=Durusdinium trenchii TaxID=1381693 RepID=A0ABP0QW24_9DINO
MTRTTRTTTRTTRWSRLVEARRNGTKPASLRARVLVKTLVGVGGMVVGLLCMLAVSYLRTGEDGAQGVGAGRWLQEDCSDFVPVRDGQFQTKGTKLCEENENLLVLTIFLMLYMFWALAITVDESFVPILDFIVQELQIDEDVAGATFMAAGGSAPEFFTNLISTFELTGTGFGTIVGSAVFNILFVISMSAFFSRDRDEVVRRRLARERGEIITDPWVFKPLPLTWWPLLRDSVVYISGLTVLALFYFCFTEPDSPIQGTCNFSDGGEILWCESLVLFIMYIGYCTIMGFQRPIKLFVETRMPFLIPEAQRPAGSSAKLKGADDESGAGVMQPGHMKRTGPSHSDISNHSAVSEDSSFTSPKIKMLQKQASVSFKSEELATGKVSFANTLSRRGLLVNNDLGRRNSNISAVSSMLESGSMVEEAVMVSEASDGGAPAVTGGASEDENQSVDIVEPRMRPLTFMGDPRRKGDQLYRFLNAILFIASFPIVLANWTVLFGFDSLMEMESKPKRRAAATFAFIMSLVWIAFFTWIMVYSAETFAATIGIPDIILGFTLLAAGTSTPDLLSSVFVAQLGYGDMAVSSSIGSNVFDILVGLPIPWLLSSLINSAPVPVETGSVGYSLGVIIAMMISLVGIIIYEDWKLTKTAAWAMLVLYFVFLIAVLVPELV